MLCLELSGPGIRAVGWDLVAGSYFEVEVQVVRQKVGVGCGHRGLHQPSRMPAVA